MNIKILITLITTVLAANPYQPPVDGKYFYSDIVTGGDSYNDEKFHAMNMLVSDDGL